MSHIDYRKDIDGLRSVAIIIVLIFHAFPKALTGGFVGVDVFFVISGFLISKNIIQNLNQNTFSLLDFYSRRIKRIFPALILALIFTLLLGWFILFSAEIKNLTKHALAAAGFVSNLVLWKESGYFDVSSDLKPLLHLWSLGIEEQFYLAWPLLLGLCFKKPKAILFVILSTIAISFLANIAFIETQPSMVFFNPLTRVWELAIGAGLAFLEIHSPSRLKKLRDQILLKHFLSAAGIILILSAAKFLNSGHSFPGYFALAPVLGSFLMIAAGPTAFCNRILSKTFFVFIGLISYPLYLFHWPLISYSHILYSHNPPEKVIWLIVVLSFVLAWSTYQFVELPLKTKWKKKFTSAQINTALVAGLIVLCLFSLSIFKTNFYKFGLTTLEGLIATKKEYYESISGEKSKQCQQKFFKIEMCAISDLTKNPTVVAIGDSHANQFFPALQKYYDQKNENILLLAKSGILPFTDTRTQREGETEMENVFKWALGSSSIHTIILAGFWSNYFNETGTATGHARYKGITRSISEPQLTDQKKIFELGFEKTLSRLTESNKQIVFFFDTLAVPFYLNSCVDRANIKNLSAKDEPITCTFEKIAAQFDQQGYRNSANIILKKFPKVRTFDPMLFNCDEHLCYVVKDNQFIYSDEHHLSVQGAEKLIQKFSF